MRSSEEPGSMPYSAVIQPLPLLRKNGGTRSSSFAVQITFVSPIEEAIALANDSVYGLAAGIFTENVEWAMKFAREAEAGNLHVNWGSQWRVDLMPYGGLKDSGFGKEGPRYAVEEMTELKMVVFHLNS